MTRRCERSLHIDDAWDTIASDQGMGTVYLVGAGPGDPDLITVRGKFLLRNCEAVVYDALIPHELVAALPPEVERYYVGKKTGRHSLPQEEINDLLVRLAAQGKRVVRLKGGDPFVFGRGAEEAGHLKDHGVRYEIVPGISSGIAAPAFAGIPCTDRSEASYVVFLTGHKAVGKLSSSVPWDWVSGAKNGTLIIYMGVSEIRKIVHRLIDGGMPPDMPAAAVERGTLSTQRSVITTLANLPDRVVELGVKPPTVFVIGKIVNLQGKLEWFLAKPLSGIRVMVTQPGDQAETLYRDLRELGAEVLAFPTIATVEDFRCEEWDALRSIEADVRWLLFTSENGVRYFLEHWCDIVGDLRSLAEFRIAAVGSKTIGALRARGIVADLVPERATTEDLVEVVAGKLEESNASVVRVRGDLSDGYVEESLQQIGAKVLLLHVYRTIQTQWSAEAKEALFGYPPNLIIFTSASAVDGFAANLVDDEMGRLTESATVVSIGPSTSKRIRSYGMMVGFESKRRTTQSIVDEILGHHRAVSVT